MTKYNVDAEVSVVTVPTTITTAAGDSHADVGTFLMTFSNGSGVVFASREEFELVTGAKVVDPEEAQAKHEVAVAAAKKGAKTKARHERQAEAKANPKPAPEEVAPPAPEVVVPPDPDPFSDRISKPFSDPWGKS